MSKAKAMRGKRAVALSIVFVLSSTGVAQARDEVADQKTKVARAEAGVVQLQKRLSALLAEMQGLNDEVAATSGQIGIARLRIERLEARAAKAQAAFNERAREAYKRSGWREAHFLLGLRSLSQTVSFGRYVGNAIQTDVDAYEGLIAAKEALASERSNVETERRLLVESDARIRELRESIAATLASEQASLASEKGLLQQLEQKRRAEALKATKRTVSPAVEARRSARQVILDQKLSALLAWYAPGSGAEPFMPQKLKGSGIVTTGLTSWYGPGFDGRRASSGATYRQEQFTAASLLLPFGTLLKVTYNSRSVVVVITDRGPYIPGRVLDLSAGAASAIGVSGVKSVRMEIVTPTEPAPPFP